MIMACRPWTDLHPQPLGFLTGCLAVCTGWGGPEPWNPVTGFKPAGASLLKAVGSFWGEDSRDLSLSLDRKSCGFCYYQLEMLPIRRVVADSIATNRSVHLPYFFSHLGRNRFYRRSHGLFAKHTLIFSVKQADIDLSYICEHPPLLVAAACLSALRSQHCRTRTTH